MIVIWIAAIVVFGIVEAVTVGLVSIWFVLGAVAGLLAAVLGAMGLSARFDADMRSGTIILTGMVLSLFINAIITMLCALKKEYLNQLVFWQMGSFSGGSMKQNAVLLAVLPPLLGMGMFSVWVARALTFLVISCPCALVISIPLSFFGGIGGASKCGILVKGGNYLEALSKTGVAVFDKTGTLTQGRDVCRVAVRHVERERRLGRCGDAGVCSRNGAAAAGIRNARSTDAAGVDEVSAQARRGARNGDGTENAPRRAAAFEVI